jgi:hypothetical protein
MAGTLTMRARRGQRPRRAWLSWAWVPACAVLGCGLWAGCTLPGSAVRADADAPEPLEVRLWRAGRVLHPGLPAVRAAELEAERGRAVAELARGLTPAEEMRWEALLASESAPDELWCAAARVVAALERYDLAPLLSGALEPSASARRTVAARASLHTLYGRWFRQPAELEPFLGGVRGGEGTRLLLAAGRSEEARSRERLFAELAHEPARAEAWLEDPDPEVRTGSAAILAQVFTREGWDAQAVLEALVAHLEAEHEPAAFHAGLQACVAPLERTGVDEPSSARLRALLVDIARAEGDPRTLPAAQALARIPWRSEGARDLGHLLTGVEALGAMARGLAGADRRRGINDPDPLVAVLAAQRELCARASAVGLTAELRASPARESLLDVLGDARQDDAVRAAAVAALGPLARPSDGPELARLLAEPSLGAQVKHALLGTLSAILTELGPSGPGAVELLAAVAQQSAASDADLRGRALSLLADPRLEPLVRRLDPSFLLARLHEEPERAATLELLGLLARFGRPEQSAELLASPRFDALASDPALLDGLAGVLVRLTGTGGADVMAMATRLVRVPSEETSLTRLRQALSLVASLDAASAFELEPAEHRAVEEWVWRVVRAGVAPRDLAPVGLAFEQRLLEVHLPRAALDAAEGEGLEPFETAHLGARLRADVFLGAPGGARGTKVQVESAFEGALALASTREQRFSVLRDRARFRAAANECVKAMSDYRRLLEAGPEADAWLGIPDLRSAVELLHRLDEAGGEARAATAGEASQLLQHMIARPAWRAEPASVRMQDLRDWVRTALEAGEPAGLRRVEAALADLPLTQQEIQVEREPVPLWLGLTREAAWFQELLDLRIQARLGLRALEARG